MNYTHITQAERYQIYALNKAGISQSRIAGQLNRNPSTISRELRRNKGLKGYRPKQAQIKAATRKAINAHKIADETWQVVRDKLHDEWSPEQIGNHVNISHESIYQWVYRDKSKAGDLWKRLRCQKKNRKRYGKIDRRGNLIDRRSIDDRPEIVTTRQRLGDWEADTIIGKNHKQAIVSLVERKSGFTLIQKVERKTSEAVGRAMMALLRPFKNKVLTITSDNGREFAGHKEVATAVSADFYFAHPYSSWERGTNENTNGLIRQYFPKNRDFTTIENHEIETTMRKLNHRPRKRLGFKTPHEVFYEMKGIALHT